MLFSLNKIKGNISLRSQLAQKVERIFNLSQKEFKTEQVEQLLASIRYAAQNSAFYMGKFKGIELPAKEEEFCKMPFTTRDEIKAQYPFGLRAAPLADIVRYGESTGTTGTPIPALYTEADWIENNYTVACFLQSILNENDIVAIAAPYELAFVAQDLDRAIESIGCTVISIGALTKIVPPERMIKIFKDLGVTALICAATRSAFILDTAIELGYRLEKDFRISKILTVGECTSDAKTKILSKKWNAEIYSMFGMTETNTLGMYCPEMKMHIVESKTYFEVIDPNTLELVEDGIEGELVVTSLHTKGMPLIRYRTGDRVRIDKEMCSCGLPFRTMRHLGRLQDTVILNNREIPIIDLEEEILDVSGSLFYTLEMQKNEIKIGLTLSDSEVDNIRTALHRRLDQKFGVNATISSTPKDKIKEIIGSYLKPNMKAVFVNEQKAGAIK